ncbi:hypothetical protein CWI39_2533p0010, partial [Hamiltosporidium magnivora]
TARIADLGHSCFTTETQSRIESNTITRFPSGIPDVLRFSMVFAGLYADESGQEDGRYSVN